MSKTKIEWADFTINPVKGLCPMACSYCYARRMYKRFGWNPEVRLDRHQLYELEFLKPSRIFVGSTMELFGPWVKDEWMGHILTMAASYPQHTFIFLTKQPQSLAKWSPFPDNCWVGVSATNQEMYDAAVIGLMRISAKIKFISTEPLLGRIKPQTGYSPDTLSEINWLIIGQQTPVRKSTMPRLEWVKEIVEAADQAGIPVFLKDNLAILIRQNDHNLYSYPKWAGKQFAVTGDHSLAPSHPHPNEPMRLLRQEFPEVKER